MCKGVCSVQGKEGRKEGRKEGVNQELWCLFVFVFFFSEKKGGKAGGVGGLEWNHGKIQKKK